MSDIINPRVSGKFSIYPMVNGKPDYQRLLFSNLNTIQWQTYMYFLREMLTVPINGNNERERLSSSFYLAIGTNSTASTRFDSDNRQYYGDVKTVLNYSAGFALTSKTFTKVGDVHTGKYFFNIGSPPVGTYQEIGIQTSSLINYSGFIPFNYGLCRSAFPFTFDGSPVVIVYELSLDNTPVDNSAFVSTEDETGYNRSLKNLFVGAEATSGSVVTGMVNTTDNTINTSFSGLKTGEETSNISGSDVPYLGNGTGPDGLTGATKIQYIKRWGYTFTDLPVGTYTSFFINKYDYANANKITIFHKLINLVISSPTNTTTIYVDTLH